MNLGFNRVRGMRIEFEGMPPEGSIKRRRSASLPFSTAEKSVLVSGSNLLADLLEGAEKAASTADLETGARRLQ